MVPVDPMPASVESRTPGRVAFSSGPLRSLGSKRWWWALAGVVALGALVVAFRPHESVAPRYETVSADRGRVTARVTATGTLSALVTVQVGSQVSGRIQELHADFNSPVTEGEVIARIDPELFNAAVEQGRANLVAATGNLAQAQAQADDAARQAQRSTELFERRLVAPADRDTAVSNAVAAKARVQATLGSVAQARAALHQAEVNLAYTAIVSPIDGVVISRNVDVGQTVAASLSAPVLFTIAEDLKRMQVDTSVPEADVGKLTAGMLATFSVDAYPGRPFQGKVRQIRNAPQTVQNVVTYDAVIDVDNLDLGLKPGMTANVSFVYADRDDVVRLPNAALRFRPPARPGPARGAAPTANARGRSVWRVDGPDAQPLAVETGVTDGTWTELVSGEVNPGDRLAVALARDTAAPGSGASGGPPNAGGPGGPGAPGGMMRRLF